MTLLLQELAARTRAADLVQRVGVIRRVAGLAVESDGPDAALGEVCRIAPRGGRRAVLAEVVALGPGSLTLLPHGRVDGLSAGDRVEATGRRATIPVGERLLGRVIDGFGQPLDAGPPLAGGHRREVKSPPQNPLQRPRVTDVLETGIRAIDAFLTLGRGQRVGLFAGSGVGKSTLLGLIARHVKADVNVIALIGERGREVREFIDKHLGDEGLARSVVVAAPADQPALARLHAAYAALSIAEAFRDEGRHVLLTMDSLTRFAMARREVGLSAGEPPTARGYTPSVFAELPELCERCGTAASGGSMTALMTVLVEGDDPNEPVADSLRAILDGHIVLSRALAQRAHFPAIDVLQSTSRVMGDIVTPEDRRLVHQAAAALALLDRNRQLVEIGAYSAGSHRELDEALKIEPALRSILQQADGGAARSTAMEALARALGAAT